MRIKIEIDVRPDELRKFLGFPDVTALPADVVGFVRDLAGAATEFDATQFVKANLSSLSEHSPALQKLLARVRISGDAGNSAAEGDAAQGKSGKGRKSGKDEQD
ncbi:hypothetical protein [Sinimarinibacterium sp. NLF-5-8]|uniref:hypothetical protein n=1 Tax=Sinimarinibacterium sp. NLF-5-8 TaxID=2698684 RepID=UPI00137BEEC0|nr:hypothetical protein [Sinimarinibacterium sp. NLF-5-8]QHS11151.1 hypothetical protein GT972_14045 [Sinimarinibacterium sp. NLF-5-8]